MRRAAIIILTVPMLLPVASARAQPPDDLRIRYNAGQPVVPIFEGWERLRDGSFDMIFGYMNRNYVEEVIVPVGAANTIEPGGPDQGQPAYFYPRANHFVFRVNVPSDWGSKELVWTLTVHGRTEAARGSLAPIWQIDPIIEIQNSGGGAVPAGRKVPSGPPPSVVIEPVIRPSATSAARTAGQPVTFTKDVAPILQRSCQTCHRPDTAAPMSLLSYDEVRPWAQAIKARVAAREMPPWHVDRNVGIPTFKDDPSLTDDEIATVVRWVDLGAPRGNPDDLPPPRQFDSAETWQIGKPDFVVSVAAHKVPATGADWWGVYTVPSGLTEDRYIKAVEAKPGSRTTAKVVHHILAYAEDADARDDSSLGNDGVFGRGEFLVEYSVGKGGERFPDGSARLLRAGSRIRFEVHYHSVGEELTDASQIAFIFYPKGYVPEHVQYTRSLGHGGEFDIPPGAGYVRSDGYSRFDSPGVLTAFQPHMHARGKAECLELIYPTGGLDDKVEQIACAKFEFGSVMVYNWADDVRPIYPAGTILHVINWHDNSPNKSNPDATNWVGNGNRTIDEMGFSWVSYYNLTEDEYGRILETRRAAQGKADTLPDPGVQPAHGSARALAAPTNVPVYTPHRAPAGISASVIVYRGPAAVSFEPAGFTLANDGQVTVKAMFTAPGVYVLRVIASDGMLRATNNVTVTVGDQTSSNQR